MERSLKHQWYRRLFDVGQSRRRPLFQIPVQAIFAAVTVVSLVPLLGAPLYAGDDGIHGSWHKAYNSRSRLVAGMVTNPSGEEFRYAGVQIRLESKWKTYWRSPGEAGGVPPTFDWSGSKNVSQLTVEYPAPVRLDSGYGENIGYREHVTFPVSFQSVDPAQPSELRLIFHYGACEDICVPATAKLSLNVPASGLSRGPSALSNAVQKVPNKAPALSPKDPRLLQAKFVLSGAEPHITLDIKFSPDDVSGDVFVEGSGGTYIPMSRLVSDTNVAAGTKRFRIDMSKDVDLADINGRTLRVTIVGDTGQSEYEIVAQ